MKRQLIEGPTLINLPKYTEMEREKIQLQITMYFQKLFCFCMSRFTTGCVNLQNICLLFFQKKYLAFFDFELLFYR